MANPEHLEILKQGVEVWNEWRLNHPETIPDFSFAKLSETNLSHANLSFVDLRRANLVEADLSFADLSWTLSAVANFRLANLCEANFTGANLSWTDLRWTKLMGVKFNKANLGGAELIGAELERADFSEAVIEATAFGNNDLSQVRGLDTVRHNSPSTIGIETIYRSSGSISEIFLRGCGVPEDFITYMRSMTIQPIQFYSCFISYSSKDQDFADRLYTDLQNKGVRCWLASEDLKIGAEIRIGIDESIRLHDKLLLVLSETSVKSQWVQQEVETALAKEREQSRTVLFPIRLDDTVMQINTGWPAYLKNTRNIGDFTRWKDHDSYQKAFDRLLRDLKAEEK